MSQTAGNRKGPSNERHVKIEWIIFQIIANPESWEQIIRASSALLVLAGLLFLHNLIHRMVQLISIQGAELLNKLNFEVYGFIISFTLWWFLLDLPSFEYQATLVRFNWSVILFFSAYLIFDMANYVILSFHTIGVPHIRIPQIIINLLRGLFFIIIILIILQTQHKLDIQPFLTGSAIITAIIGLALQDTLGNTFSGLALHISRPFDLGHWIRFGDTEGTVVRVDWRATTIKTREEDYLTIPNSQLAKSELINFSTPTTVHGQYIYVGVRYEYPPNKIKRLLIDSALKTEGVIKEINPTVLLETYNDFSIDYRMRFFVDDYKSALQVKSAIMERIWYVFKRNNVEIPFPIRDVYMRTDKTPEADSDEMLDLLSQVDFLSNLKDQELRDIALRLKKSLFSRGETVIKQGDAGDTFYIIKSGTVRVTATNPYGDVFLDKELKEGNFFGEISVLTGEPRTASITAITDVELLVLDKEDFEQVIKKHPDIDTRISEKIASRQQHSFEQMEIAQKSAISEKEAKEKAQKRVQSLSHQLLTKIRSFFSIK